MITVAERLGEARVIGGHDAALDNIRAACALGLPTVLPAKAHRGIWVMCGGGPSLKDSIKHIRRRYLSGETIACVNGSLKYLLENKITPHICILLDPQELLAGETMADARVDYLVASQCHPNIFELLRGCRVTLWHAEMDAPMAHVIGEHYSTFELVPGPESVPLKSVMLAYGLGFREMHLYGVDACYSADKDGNPVHHAYEQKNDDQFDMICVKVRDTETDTEKEFITRTDWARQADQFNDMLEHLAPDLRLYVHGEGLIPHIWKHRRKHVRATNSPAPL